ncbi:unnamed protein product [Sympodiomycopsis kandeliae]
MFTIRLSEPKQAYSYTAAASSSSKKGLAPSAKSLKATFAAAAGEAIGSWAAGNGELRMGNEATESLAGGAALEIRLKLAFKVDAGVSCTLPTAACLVVSTVSPPAIQTIPWPDSQDAGQTETILLPSLPWILGNNHEKEEDSLPNHDGPSNAPRLPLHITNIYYSSAMDLYVWITSDGRAYVVTLQPASEGVWHGRCFHGTAAKIRRKSSLRRRASKEPSDSNVKTDATHHHTRAPSVPEAMRASNAAINAKMGLISIGQVDGLASVYILRSQHKAVLSHRLSLRNALQSTATHLASGSVQCQQWTSDGLALAIGWEAGWSVWSAWGKLMGHSYTEDLSGNRSKNFSDAFMTGVQELFWGPNGNELFVMANQPFSGQQARPDRQLFSIPHAKSALAGQHSPDNTRFAFIQLDESLLVYRGSDQPDMSIINPESDVWHHIHIPQDYIASNWPIRYACISSDGLLIAIAGRRGLAHYSASSGRWKLFSPRSEEEAFTIRGGMQWYQHVLVVACQSGEESQLRLYSRDTDLSDSNLLYSEVLPSTVILTNLFEDSLLVYTSDNTFYHYLIVITADSITLQLCGSITFEGVVGEPERVRGMSWMIPKSQQQLGDPMDDLTVATIIFLVDGKLVLLRPRKAGQDSEEVAYDMQILGDRIEYYWTHLHGIGTLENSLWGYDGSGIKLWLDALTIEQAEPRAKVSKDPADGEDAEESAGDEDVEYEEDIDEEEMPEYKTIEESLSMPLQFYPLCVVLEKGIIIGVEPEISIRKNLDFTVFRSGTTTHLFLHQLLRYYLERGSKREAVICASFYRDLVYFSHALEILLHAVLEEEADSLIASEQAKDSGDSSRQNLSTSTSGGSVVLHDDLANDSIESDEGISTSASRSSGLDGDVTVDRNGFIEVRGCHTSASGSQIRNGKPSFSVLPIVVEFLDHFDESLSVVVNCARKTEFVRWEYLFSIVGPPQDLFAKCIEAGDLKTAASYLLVLQNLEPYEHSLRDTARLLRLAMQAENWLLCQDLLRYTRSMDEGGSALKEVVDLAGLLAEEQEQQELHVPDRTASGGHGLFRPPPQAQERPTVVTPPRRSLSSSSTMLETSEEVDEEEEQQGSAAKPMALAGSTTGIGDGSPVPRRSSITRSYSNGGGLVSHSASPSLHVAPPPVPQVSINGRIMPATSVSGTSGMGSQPSAESSPSFLRRSSSSAAVPAQAVNGGASPKSAGLGMSLHRVGLRSAEQLFLNSGSIGGRRSSASSEREAEEREGGVGGAGDQDTTDGSDDPDAGDFAR